MISFFCSFNSSYNFNFFINFLVFYVYVFFLSKFCILFNDSRCSITNRVVLLVVPFPFRKFCVGARFMFVCHAMTRLAYFRFLDILTTVSIVSWISTKINFSTVVSVGIDDDFMWLTDWLIGFLLSAQMRSCKNLKKNRKKETVNRSIDG